VGHHPADVSDPAQIADMISYAEREFGGIDILVNNAGIQHVDNVSKEFDCPF
jgi:3-hydroxybutyrate dehydrogenase